MESFDEKYFDRNRVTPKAKSFETVPVLLSRLGYVKFARLLRTFGVKLLLLQVGQRSKLEEIRRRSLQKRRRKVHVTDRTEIESENSWIYVFVRIGPEDREIVNFPVTRHQKSIDTLIFLKKRFRHCEASSN